MLLDAHFALLQRPVQQGESQAEAGIEGRSLAARRSQALTALVRLTSAAPCQELLYMQERLRVLHWARKHSKCVFYLYFKSLFGFALIFLFCSVNNTTALCQCFGLRYSETPQLVQIFTVMSISTQWDRKFQLFPSSYLPCCFVQACQLAVVTTPRDSDAQCLLGLAQLAQHDNNPNLDRSNEAITPACLSLQASIELENKTKSGEPPDQLSSDSV